MRQSCSNELLLSILNGLDDGISVLKIDDETGAQEVVFENAQAASFRAAGAARSCVRVLEKELTVELGTSSSVTEGATSNDAAPGAASDAKPKSKLILQVDSNPLTSKVVRAVLNEIPEICYVGVPATGDAVFANNAWVRFSPDLSEGLRSWSKLLHPDDKDGVMAAWFESASTSKPYEKSYRLLKKEGGDLNDVVWINAKAGHICNSHGTSIMIVGLLMDQTEIMSGRQLLAHEQSFLRTAIDAVPVGVAIARKGLENAQDSIVFSNKEVERIWRTDAIPLRGVGEYSEYVLFNKEGKRPNPDEWPMVRSLTKGEVIPDEHYTFHRFDGTVGTIAYACSPVIDKENGAIIGAVAISRDVTEMLSAEKERTARLAAEQAETQMRRMVANVSHEIRTPIAGVIGLASLLEDSVLDEDQRELIEGIRESGQLLLSVINDLLDHSKIAAGKMDLEKKPFDLRSLINHALRMTAEVAKTKDLRLITRFDPSLPAAIVGSELRFKQVLLNLLSNAAKFTPPGGTITLEGRAEMLSSTELRQIDPSAAPHVSVSTSAITDPCVVNSAASTAANSSLAEDGCGSDFSPHNVIGPIQGPAAPPPDMATASSASGGSRDAPLKDAPPPRQSDRNGVEAATSLPLHFGSDTAMQNAQPLNQAAAASHDFQSKASASTEEPFGLHRPEPELIPLLLPRPLVADAVLQDVPAVEPSSSLSSQPSPAPATTSVETDSLPPGPEALPDNALPSAQSVKRLAEAGAALSLEISEGDPSRPAELGVLAANHGEPLCKSSVMLHFSLRDTGIGLTKDQMSRLFRPFMQADTSTTRQYGGTGLGLALCRDILELLGGSIRVESEGEGKGSCFHFSFAAEVATLEPPHEEEAVEIASPLSFRPVRLSPHRPEVPAPARMHEPWTHAPGPLSPVAAGFSALTVAKPELEAADSWQLLARSVEAPPTHDSARPGRLEPITRPTLSASFDDSSPTHSHPFSEHDRPSSGLQSLPPIATGARPAFTFLSAATPSSSLASPSPRLRHLPPLERLVPEGFSATASASAATSSAPTAPSALETRPPRILVVDDVALNRTVARRYLQKLGYNDICIACDGSEAVNMVRDDAQGIDIVLMDLMMPVMGGAEAAVAIKALPIPNPPPVVAVSAATNERDRLGNLFFDWLPKPFSAKELRDIIEKCLTSRPQLGAI